MLILFPPIGLIFIWFSKVFNKTARIIISCVFCVPIILLIVGILLGNNSSIETLNNTEKQKNEQITNQETKKNEENSEFSDNEEKDYTNKSIKQNDNNELEKDISISKKYDLTFLNENVARTFEYMETMNKSIVEIIDLVNQGEKCYSDGDGVDINKLQQINEALKEYNSKVEEDCEVANALTTYTYKEGSCYSSFLDNCQAISNAGSDIINLYTMEYTSGLDSIKKNKLSINKYDFNESINKYDEITQDMVERLKNNGFVK